MTPTDLLDAARAKLGPTSTDTDIARILGITKQTLNDIRAGRILPPDHLTVRIATLAGVPPAPALTYVDILRAKDPETRRIRQHIHQITKIYSTLR